VIDQSPPSRRGEQYQHVDVERGRTARNDDDAESPMAIALQRRARTRSRRRSAARHGGEERRGEMSVWMASGKK